MKCIINCPDVSTAWVRDYFSGLEPYLLPIGNKPLLEYFIDFCVLGKIDEIRIVSDNLSDAMHQVLGDGTRWNLKISYSTVPADLSMTEMLKRNAAFIAKDDLLVISGMVFMNYNKHDFALPEYADTDWFGEIISKNAGWFIRGRNCVLTEPRNEYNTVTSRKFRVEPLTSVRNYYDLNMTMIYALSNNYDLPGYTVGSQKVFVGRNVVIPRTAEVTEPVMLDDSIQLSRDTQVGPGAIIGANSLIDNSAMIVDTIVLGNSYVGCNLELRGKVVYQNLIIDPNTGIKLDIVDDFLLTPLVRANKLYCPLKQRFAALILLIFQTIPFILLRLLIKVESEPVDCYLNQRREKKIRLHLYVRPAESWAGRWFRKLSLDRYHLLPLVLRGELRLVGSLIMEANERNGKMLKQFPEYSPGIFSYSELLEHENDPLQREMDELYYMYHTCFSLNWQIFTYTLVRNLLKRK